MTDRATPAPQQLPLQVQLPDDELFSTFYQGSNAAVVDWLRDLVERRQQVLDSDRYTWLSGPTASGKSHLLHATVAAVSQQDQQAMYLPMSDLISELHGVDDPSALLEGLEQFDLLCLDDVDAVLTDERWCFELFALVNRVLDRGQGRLIMTASQAVKRSNVALADLRSRLQWATAFQLTPLDDAEKVQALMLRAKWRGLNLPEDVAQFMLHRLGRDMNGLMKRLNQLDTASIAQQRRLTIPFVKQTLSI